MKLELICERYGIDDVCIGGGVFQNRRLLASLQHKWHHGTLYNNKKYHVMMVVYRWGNSWIAYQKIYKRITGYIRVLSFVIQRN